MSKKVVLMEFESNPNIGLYMFANDKFCILGREVDSKKKKEIESVLGVKVYTITALGTELIGVFVSGNNEMIVIPEMFDYEQKEIEKICKKYDVKLFVLPNKINTYGNSLCIGSDEILINSDYGADFVKELKSKTKLNVLKIDNKEFRNVGGVIRFLNEKYYVSQELEKEDVKSILKKVAGVGSVNSGAAFVSSGIVGNSNGLVLGSMCSTVEIQDIVESLDYL